MDARRAKGRRLWGEWGESKEHSNSVGKSRAWECNGVAGDVAVTVHILPLDGTDLQSSVQLESDSHSWKITWMMMSLVTMLMLMLMLKYKNNELLMQ